MIQEKRDELIRRFGNKFFNELGDRVIKAQRSQGIKPGQMNDTSMALAHTAIEEIWKEWVEDCDHVTDKGALSLPKFCAKCKSYITKKPS